MCEHAPPASPADRRRAAEAADAPTDRAELDSFAGSAAGSLNAWAGEPAR
jgi:hypothetical protein